jgi:hypothetical protein
MPYADDIIKQIIWCFLERKKFTITSFVTGAAHDYVMDFRGAQLRADDIVKYIRLHEPRALPPTPVTSDGQAQVADVERPGALTRLSGEAPDKNSTPKKGGNPATKKGKQR